jgi:hypothetical protein
MFPGFYLDLYKVVQPWERKSYGKISEALVIGRLAESQKNGLLSQGGLLGYALQKSDSVADMEKQYRIYTEKLPYTKFSTYKSITGFQAFLYGLVDKATHLTNDANLNLFRFINSVLLSASLAFILVFIFYYFGFFAYLSALFAIIFSICLTAMGFNLFFCLWAFYFPMIVMMFILSYEDITGKFSQRTASLLICSSIFIKCLFNGFDFITTILIMTIVPLFFFMIRNKWSVRMFFRRIIILSTAAVAGVILNMIFLAVQISVHKNSVNAGVNHLIKSFYKRTGGIHNNFDFDPLVTKSLNASVSDALNNQFAGIAYRVDWIPGIINTRFAAFHLNYANLIVIFAVATALLLLFIKQFPPTGSRRNVLGLIGMSWVSFLAPISWYVIFKAHAYIHVSLDLLAWYMPFAIFGAAIIGLLIKALYFFICQHSRWAGKYNHNSGKG